MERVVVIGSGNLAENLARAIAKSDLQLVQLYARNAARAREIAAACGVPCASESAKLAAADIYLFAVSDRAIAPLAAALPIPLQAAVVHTAGSVPLQALPARFTRRAVCYPLQTFTRGREVDFSNIPLFLECDDPQFRPHLEAFARRLSPTVLWAGSALRAELHLAGVFACNFVNQMYLLGERIVGDAGLDFGLLKPLIRETAAKALDAESPLHAQTGPAARGDCETLRRHERMLADKPDLKKIYETLSQSIWETSKKR